ncbi:hypothetical protein BLD48_05740 [Exiguobacterium sp. KRL4]|uniref:phage tail assembly chaperone n=1 Tax=Exiguobacterium sp. KRL4 TaxID=1914536 RepID=UPI0008F84233|nr:hypothetical protein [Exiguobacterium sp. KRL4]OIN67392.1 hypothetical protein BLD48_05740 [Exiguobacterium sp. KRL4]
MAKTMDKSKIDLLLGFDLVAPKEITPSQRIKDLGITITVKPLDEDQFKEVRASAVSADGKADEFKMATKTIQLALVDPSPEELMNATGSLTQELAIKKIFNVGERVSMSEEIMKISGFGPVQEEVEDLKN